jgi:septal ring factor EnvC (AmiA/AmiB activator)
LAGALTILACLSILLLVSNSRKKVIIEDITAQFELDKEELQDDYSQLALQYEDYGIRINNDSLAELLDAERTKNLRLLDEIKTLKVNNARRLSELRKELETARTVMRSYIVQIDSLNTLNNQLREENSAMTRQYEEAKQTVNALSKEKEALTEKVMLASMLEARDIEIRPLTDKGRPANKIARTSIIEGSAVVRMTLVSSPSGLEITTERRKALSAGKRILS